MLFLLSVLVLLSKTGFVYAQEVVKAGVPIDLGYRTFEDQHINLSPGIKVNEAPYQKALDTFKTIHKNNYELMLLDDFKIKGLVLSKRPYLADFRADIAPMDIVLGWKRMSDPAILKNIGIRQNYRFYFWHVEDFPLPRQELESSSTNIHLIPATPQVEEKIKSIRKGQVVSLKGYLVDAKAPDGFLWVTSRSRNDTGDGACEILLATSVEVETVN